MKKMFRYLPAAMLIAAMALGACTDDNSDSTSTTIDSDSMAKANGYIDVNGDRLYRGIVVDGSRSNINLRFYDDTLDFEIPSDIDFTYEVGDSVSILVKTAANGADSIAEVKNHAT